MTGAWSVDGGVAGGSGRAAHCARRRRRGRAGAMERWTGRVALVTGASVGIGAAVARALVQHGMKVVGCARSVDKIEVQGQGPRAPFDRGVGSPTAGAPHGPRRCRLPTGLRRGGSCSRQPGRARGRRGRGGPGCGRCPGPGGAGTGTGASPGWGGRRARRPPSSRVGPRPLREPVPGAPGGAGCGAARPGAVTESWGVSHPGRSGTVGWKLPEAQVRFWGVFF